MSLSSVIQICRGRRIDGRLVLYVEHYLNPQYFPGILECDLNQSMTELYARKYDLHYGRVRFEIVPTSLPVEAAAGVGADLAASCGAPDAARASSTLLARPLAKSLPGGAKPWALLQKSEALAKSFFSNAALPASARACRLSGSSTKARRISFSGSHATRASFS